MTTIADPLVSIVIPVYNTDKYLGPCLESVLHQTLNDIEIILIDDGSTDDSGRICDDYARKDKRITVIHQNNKGLSNARNYGIRKARSKYIMFVDSDDIVDPYFCKIPYEIAHNNDADLVMFESYDFPDGGEICFKDHGQYEIHHSDNENAIREMLSHYNCTAWNKLYEKSIFSELKFPEGRTTEDVGTTYKAILKAERIFCTDTVLYFYRKREGSITTKRTIRRIINCFVMYEQMYNDLIRIFPEDVPPQLTAMMLNVCVLYLIRLFPWVNFSLYKKAANYLFRLEEHSTLLSEERYEYYCLFRSNKLRFHYQCIINKERLFI